MKKIRTMRENVLKYGEKKGVIIEVDERAASHLISGGFAEEVQEHKKEDKAPEEPKKRAPKKKPAKKGDDK
jgi:hypothetical protein